VSTSRIIVGLASLIGWIPTLDGQLVFELL
jgi:hypothetical protein